MMQASLTMSDHAQRYADAEVPVFPLSGKVPYADTHGHLDATSDSEAVAWAWAGHPTANIGMPTGDVSGVLVLDIDGPIGEQSLTDLETKYGPLPDTRMVRSGRESGGRHFHFAMPAPGVKSWTIAPGVELKANGRYVVLPESIHPETGQTYVWIGDPDEPLAQLPPAWVDLVKGKGKYKVTGTGPTLAPEKIFAGEKDGKGRNDTLTREGGRLRRGGWTAEEIYGSLGVFNQSRCVPPLEDDEVRKIADSVSRYEPSAVSTVTEPPSPDDAIDRRPFPTDCLPEQLQNLADDAQTTLGIPADYIAVSGMVTMAAAIGGALEIEPKRGWRDRPIIWAGILGPPGTAKSPAIDIASRPLTKLQGVKREDWSLALAAWKDAPKEERDGPAPRLEIIETTDATVEGLARALLNSRGILAKHDELTAWIAGHNRYRGKGAGERGEHLKLWAGGNLTAVRSTQEPLVIDRPTVALIGGIQPARLTTLADSHRGEFVNDGMLDRFLTAWPVASPALWSDAEMDETTLTGWSTLVTDTRNWTPQTAYVHGSYLTVRFSDQSKRVWKQWHDANVSSIESANGLTRGWASKAPRHLLRLALILHSSYLRRNEPEILQAATLEAAIEIVEWFRQQHGLMLSALSIGAASNHAGLPARVTRIIQKINDSGGWAARTDIHRGLSNNIKGDELTNALDTLVADGTIIKRIAGTASKDREEYLHSGRTYEETNFLVDDANEKRRNFVPSSQGNEDEVTF